MSLIAQAEQVWTVVEQLTESSSKLDIYLFFILLPTEIQNLLATTHTSLVEHSYFTAVLQGFNIFN